MIWAAPPGRPSSKASGRLATRRRSALRRSGERHRLERAVVLRLGFVGDGVVAHAADAGLGGTGGVLLVMLLRCHGVPPLGVYEERIT